MPNYVVLTNRKRAIIALIHSVVFLLIALRGVAVPSSTRGLFSAIHVHSGTGASAAMSGIFLIVSTILIVLFVVSGCAREKLYFGFCAASASTGLLRSLVGDPPFHSAQYVRALMLICAVVVGTMIWRGYSEAELSTD